MLEQAFETVDEQVVSNKRDSLAGLIKKNQLAKLNPEGEQSLKPCKLMQADCHNLPFEDESFDTVVDMFGLHCYYDHDQAIQEIKRVCRKDGTILIMARGQSYVSLYNTYLKFRAAKDLMEFGCVEHLDIEKLIEKHDFKVVHSERRNLGMTYVYIL